MEREPDGAYRVHAQAVERLVERTDLDEEEAVSALQRRLAAADGRRLAAAGCRDGDTVRIAGIEFTYLAEPAGPPSRSRAAGALMAAARVAVFGGTFDPFHLGHLAVAEQARDGVLADETWVVPAGVPPLHGPALAGAADRLEICRAAIAGRPRIFVLDLELRRRGPPTPSTRCATSRRPTRRPALGRPGRRRGPADRPPGTGPRSCWRATTSSW